MTSITDWNRLAMRSRVPTIEPGLEARVHDPLWMLARQYQLGEFRGEDAGSPVEVRLTLDVAPLSRYHPAGGLASGAPATDATAAGSPAAGALAPGTRVPGRLFDARHEPLEPLVEGERVHLADAATPRVGAETGLRLLRRLRAAGLDEDVPALLDAFPFAPLAEGETSGTDPAERALDRPSERYLALMAGRVPDGRTARAHFVRDRGRPAAERDWPPGVPANARDTRRLGEVIDDWLDWFERHHDEPRGDASDGTGDAANGAGGAWNPARQEYAFALAAHDGEEESVFHAAEHSRGEIDWDSFDALPDVSLDATPEDPGPRLASEVHLAVPTPLAYPGMPASRWWEMEDAAVDFGRAAEDRTGLVRMLFVDYALSYADDWYLVPLDVPTGTLSRIGSLVVTDTFGIRTEIPPLARAPDAPGFRMYTASGRDEGLLLPPLAGRVVDGDPLESVTLARDEMANLAWGIETRVESPAGLPFDRHAAGRDDAAASAPTDGTEPATDATGAAFRYRLANTVVPAHWIPFLPVSAGDGDEATLFLERGKMLADEDAGGQAPTRALGRLLEADAPTLRLFDEEVPAAGVHLTRRYRHARGADGRAHLWLGRTKTSGRPGEGRSGLRFDVLEPFERQA